MTLASHARGPEFEPRCEYFALFLSLYIFFEHKGLHQPFVLIEFANKNREKNRDIGEARYEPKTALFSKKNTQKTTNFAFQGLFYYKEALGMIRTFINHSALRRSKGVDLSHTSFFKTG